MSSSSAYSLSCRRNDSKEEWNVSNSLSSFSSYRNSDRVVSVKEFSALHHLGYKWVDPIVKLPLSRFRKSSTIVALCKKVEMIASTINEHIVSIKQAKSGDNVCHGWEGHSHDFFYMYSTLVTNLHVCLPFDDFTMGILRVLNVASSQLHPNSWASIQASKLICHMFHLKPSPQVFL